MKSWEEVREEEKDIRREGGNERGIEKEREMGWEGERRWEE